MLRATGSEFPTVELLLVTELVVLPSLLFVTLLFEVSKSDDEDLLLEESLDAWRRSFPDAKMSI